MYSMFYVLTRAAGCVMFMTRAQKSRVWPTPFPRIQGFEGVQWSQHPSTTWSGENKMQYRRISADCHLDMPWMPPDLFVSEARRELKERMPYVEEGRRGPQWVAKNGANFGLKNGVGPGGAPFVPGQNHRVDKMAETGMYEDGKRDIRRCSDPHLRIKDMDRDGVDAEVIYGILGAASRLNDREASNEMLRIYNDFLKEFCRHYPDREIGLACLPYGNIDDAVTEIHRVAKMGLRGLELSCSWDMEPMWHPCWEPLWQAVNEVRLPLHSTPSRRCRWASSRRSPASRGAPPSSPSSRASR